MTDERRENIRRILKAATDSGSHRISWVCFKLYELGYSSLDVQSGETTRQLRYVNSGKVLTIQIDEHGFVIGHDFA